MPKLNHPFAFVDKVVSVQQYQPDFLGDSKLLEYVPEDAQIRTLALAHILDGNRHFPRTRRADVFQIVQKVEPNLPELR